ncbi:PREDICTED: F-box protein At5g51380-like [Nelumbo nucifera]|uniref:F-box protein At5g51380-like n=1 Tax=Nelumbo nucifera TaxID=4432 RepID=A0A1U8AA44_NELNU|nr:PREDICTED: F-box protein At5g51380-like [Nelumbo nucifera]
MQLTPKRKRKILRRPPSLPELWFKDPAIKRFLRTLHFRSLSSASASDFAAEDYDERSPRIWPEKSRYFGASNDLTALLSDELLLRIFSKLPDSQRNSNSLVCKRWLILHGRLVRSLKLFDWDFLESGRLVSRFPNLTDVDLVPACIDAPRNSGIFLTHKFVSFHLDSDFSSNGFNLIDEENLLPHASIDRGLRVIARGCPNLRKLVLIGATEIGLASIAEECPNLQELELHRCTDLSLRGIAACQNLQILKLIGNAYGCYRSVVSDIGLTILAHGCKRLVKLELIGCEGSYDGIKAIGQCCDMLEELTLSDHRMDKGWMAGLSFCRNLKTLRLQSCKKIDSNPGPAEYLGSCETLERLHLQRCQIRDRKSLKSLFFVCQGVREIVFQDCWGLDNAMFYFASICRRVKSLSLEGCSLLTTDGLESVVLYWKELKMLSVVSCNNIKDYEVTPALSSLFSVLKKLKWRPDSRSLLSSSVSGTGMRKKGRKFFKRVKSTRK